MNIAGPAADSDTATMTPAGKPAKTSFVWVTRLDGQVKLWWAMPDDDGGSAITKFQLRQRETDGTWGSWADVDATTTTHTLMTLVTHTVTNLTNGTSYDFQVRAVNIVGHAAASDIATETPAGKPAAVRLSAARGDTEVVLTWATPADDGGSAITKFQFRQLEIYDISWGNWTDIDGSDATTTSHTVTNLTNGTRYSFQVRAVNIVGWAADSNIARATPAGAPEPLTATWSPPQSHDGTAFTFRLSFNKNVELSFRNLRDLIIQADGAEVTKARRVVKGSNQTWDISIAPDGTSDITLRLHINGTCGDKTAICTHDGEQLTAVLSATVSRQ